MSVSLLPPSPTAPLPAQGAKGEMRLTQGGVVMFDGRTWQPADLFAAIIDDPANFNRISTNLITSAQYLLTTGDPAEVLPGQLISQTQGTPGNPARQPQLTMNPPIFNEGDQSSLASALALEGTSPDGTAKPHIYLWTKQAGAIDIGVVTDASYTIENEFGVLAGQAFITVKNPGGTDPSVLFYMNALTGFSFYGDEVHHGHVEFIEDVAFDYTSTETHNGPEGHTGTETHNGPETHGGTVHFTSSVYLDSFSTYTGQETHNGSEYHNGYENHNGIVQFDGKLRSGQAMSAGQPAIATGSYAYVTCTYGPTMSATPVVVGSLDTGSFVHYYSFSFRSTTNFRCYATNWTDTVTDIGYVAMALG